MVVAEPLRVVAVVPLYRPTSQQVEMLSDLEQEVDAIVAVDDGSGPWKVLDSAAGRAVLLRMASNVGIARCLNEGVNEARRLGATHVLTMDQDSGLSMHYVREALNALQHLSDSGIPCGGVGAGHIGPHRVDGAAVADEVRDGFDGIQSGWLLPISTLDRVGPFDEDLFIDCVDVDYLVRCSVAGLPIVVTDRCTIEHALGTGERTVRIGGRSVVFSYHRPFRRYYITRNRILMLRRHGRERPRAMVGQAVTAARIAAMSLVLGSERQAQAVAIWAGLVHGLAGRGGRIPHRIEQLLGSDS